MKALPCIDCGEPVAIDSGPLSCKHCFALLDVEWDDDDGRAARLVRYEWPADGLCSGWIRLPVAIGTLSLHVCAPNSREFRAFVANPELLRAKALELSAGYTTFNTESNDPPPSPLR